MGGMSTTPEPGDRLIDARANLQKLRAAVAVARQRASDAETARLTAEQAHAATVADALLDGKATPAKPSSLSTIQAADDSADAALALLEHRLTLADGECRSASVAEVQAGIDRLTKDSHGAARVALKGLAKESQALASAIGGEAARDVLRTVITLPFREADHLAEVSRLASTVPEVSAVAELARIAFSEARVVPDQAEILNLFRQH